MVMTMSEMLNENEIKDTAEKADGALSEAPERVVVFEEGLEAILFAAGHPVSYATLARVFEMTPSKIKDKIFEYSIKYNDPKGFPRGVMLLTYADSCQLCTKENYLPEIRDALGIRKSGSLSTAAMETLAVVAYNQPVTRVFVDTIRKVDSSYAMNSLIDRGLIECVGRLDVPGRPMLYGTTSDFLRCFGLSDLDALPHTTDEMKDAFAKAKLDGEEKDELDEAQMEIIDGEGEVNADAAESDEEVSVTDGHSVEDEPTLDEPSAEDDIIEEL